MVSDANESALDREACEVEDWCSQNGHTLNVSNVKKTGLIFMKHIYPACYATKLDKSRIAVRG